MTHENKYRKKLPPEPKPAGLGLGDVSTLDGAERLAAHIREFWHQRGYDLPIEIVYGGSPEARHTEKRDVYGLRSNIANLRRL